jgi:branched-chain amino acid transport system ATP-binding protein
LFAAERIDTARAAGLVRRGLVQVMEGRHCFGHLTIEENLLTGAWTRGDGPQAVARSLEMVYEYFPRLRTRRLSRAATTSGGEQQMCAIGRALMGNPRLVLLDEPSMGLAPQLVDEVFRIVCKLNGEQGVSFLVAEQNSRMALRYACHGYILESGRVALHGPAAQLAGMKEVQEVYLGLAGGGRQSYREAAAVGP